MSSRDEILAGLRNRVREVEQPQPWQSRRQFEDLAERFEASLTAVSGELIRAQDLDDAWQKLNNLLLTLEVQNIAANHEPPITQLPITQLPAHLNWHIIGQTDGDLKTFCETAEVGLTSADAALAETGSLVISSGSGKSRQVSLLPPIHIALLPESKLHSDIFTWTAQRKKEVPTNIVLISGPSKTADIELTLVKGVHGPKRFIVILYGD